MAVSKNKQVEKTQSESIAVQSISAINKADKFISEVEKFNAEFEKAVNNVEILKADLDLGFKKFEVEMDEKKAKLEADFAAKSVALNDDFASDELKLKADLQAISDEIVAAKAKATKEKEELAYELKKHIERENLTAATEIAYEYNKVLVSDTLIEDLNEKVALAETSLVEAVAEAKSKAETDKHIALSSMKKVYEAESKLTEGKLEAALERANRAEKSIEYLQGRLDLVPDQIAAAVKAGKADINQNNNSGK